jgi:glycogen debranching enzyme
MALSYHNPAMAWDQFMLLFDFQDDCGLIPDSVNDSHITWNYCKPPVHGWALAKMMRNMRLSGMQIQEAFNKLEKWTLWWLNYRDQDKDGICEYNHGNDSGWDNSTVFAKLPPIESPELQAFLILQMEVLADLARQLNQPGQAAQWQSKSEQMLDKMVRHCFRDGLPRAVRSTAHETIHNQSLLLYIPVILGRRLPHDIRNSLVEVLKSDKFLTDFGYATESPQSPFYKPDGYWRGPIWAPSTMLILDGLKQCGQDQLVKNTAVKFCNMVQKSGCAENFDALTGEGLRDRAYTWTASVFLILAHEFLF